MLVAVLFAPPATAFPAPPLRNVDAWPTDAQGRKVVLHGLNLAAKFPPYDLEALGFGEDDAAFLAAHGFNAVRIAVTMSALEPEPGRFDETYLKGLEDLVALLSRHGIRSMLWFSQELLSTRFRGEGLPDWMIRTDGIPDSLLNLNMGTNLFTMPAFLRAVDNLWNNAHVHGKGLQDWIAEAWIHVARRFKDDADVVGYDLFNEPWPGTAWPTCLPPGGCKDFDTKKLAPFFAKLTAAVHSVDPRHLAFYEPNLFAPFGAPIHLGSPGDGVSFHSYCADLGDNGETSLTWPLCKPFIEEVFRQAVAQSKRTGDIPMLTEFGATAFPKEIAAAIRLADRYGMSWMEWSYCKCNDQTEAAPDHGLLYDPKLPPTGSNVDAGQLAAMDEPFPQAIAGDAPQYGFDPSTRRFSLTYVPGKGDTVVYTSPLQYPSGYKMTVTGAKATTDGSHLILRALPGSTKVSLLLTPSG
jgi:endoglycosylceramidase